MSVPVITFGDYVFCFDAEPEDGSSRHHFIEFCGWTPQQFARIERAQHRIEIPHVSNGRPGYKWVEGWIVRYSLHRVSTAMQYREALDLLREEEGQA